MYEKECLHKIVGSIINDKLQQSQFKVDSTTIFEFEATAQMQKLLLQCFRSRWVQGQLANFELS